MNNTTPLTQFNETVRDKKAVSPLELFFLFKKLSIRPDVSVKIKKQGAADFSNSSCVLRASNSLIMLKDTTTGDVDFFSELRNIEAFMLDKDSAPYFANVTYPVI